jgi:DNA-directed RNA polymerase I, II, and III subunit RPABC2
MSVKNNEKKDDILEDSDLEEEEEEEDEFDEEGDIIKPNRKSNYVEDEDEYGEEEEEEDDEMDEEGDEELETKKEKTNKSVNLNSMSADDFSEADYETEADSDEEDAVDENYLQKFNDHLNIKSLEDIHPEIKTINYEEMLALSRVVRDKNGKIIDPLHTTLPFLTKYEKARIIGARAEQIDAGGQIYVQVDESIVNGRTIALMEFEQKKIPFIISRPLPNGSTEYWHLEDLEIINE